MDTKQKLMIAGGGVAALFGIMYAMRSNSASTGTGTTTADTTTPVNGFSVGGTLYVPTSEYDINNIYGNQTITHNTTTTTDAPQVSGGGTVTINNPGATAPQAGVPTPTPLSTPTPTPAPAPSPAPVPVTPIPKVTPTSGNPGSTKTAATSGHASPVVYTAFGSDAANSSLWGLSQMYLKNHVTGGKAPTNAQIQAEVTKVAKLNHISNPNDIQKGLHVTMN